MSNTTTVTSNAGNRHLRTIGKTAEWLQMIDKDTPVKYSTIRKAILKGEIKSVAVGTKRLVVLEDVYKHFYGAEIDPETVSAILQS